jgi:hypothetical protein
MQQQDTLYVAYPTCTVLTYSPTRLQTFFVYCDKSVNRMTSQMVIGSFTAAEQTIKYTLDNYTLWKPYGNVTTVAPTVEFQSDPHKARQRLRFNNRGNVQIT